MGHIFIVSIAAGNDSTAGSVDDTVGQTVYAFEYASGAVVKPSNF
jgi:hypothetical protein